MEQGPRAVIRDIADKSELAARLQRARHGGDGFVLYETPLPVPSLGPRIGVDQIYPRKRERWCACQQFAVIAGEQPDIADIVGFDLRQDFRHAVDIGLAADEAEIRKRACFRDQVLAAADYAF